MAEILMATKAEVDAISARMDAVEADDALGSSASFVNFNRPNNIARAMIFTTSPAARGALAG